jgi:hypothetical protein
MLVTNLFPTFVSCVYRLMYILMNSLKMVSEIFRDITQSSLLSVQQRFGGTYCLTLQGPREILTAAGLLLTSYFGPEDCGCMLL